MKKESIIYILSFIGVLVALTGAISYNDNRESLENFHQVEIKTGDSLWSIASEFQDKTQISKQEFVKWVQEKNKLYTNKIKPGDIVFVPIEKEQLYKVEQVASQK